MKVRRGSSADSVARPRRPPATHRDHLPGPHALPRADDHGADGDRPQSGELRRHLVVLLRE
eukprot:4451089-Alexandrium_andersonii.AAC.1